MSYLLLYASLLDVDSFFAPCDPRYDNCSTPPAALGRHPGTTDHNPRPFLLLLAPGPPHRVKDHTLLRLGVTLTTKMKTTTTLPSTHVAHALQALSLTKTSSYPGRRRGGGEIVRGAKQRANKEFLNLSENGVRTELNLETPQKCCCIIIRSSSRFARIQLFLTS